MPPAFSSTKQATAFSLLLLFLLASPWLAQKTFLPCREQTYSSESIRWEKFPWVQKFIFEETNDIDIAFVGSSHILFGVDTPYVEQRLDEKLGRKSVVRTIGWSSPGFDSLYFFTKDLLAHRHVKTLVFYDECSAPELSEVHRRLPCWFRFGEDGGVLDKLPLRYRAVYYYGAVIGMPRNWLELLVPNLPLDANIQLGDFVAWNAANPELTLGCVGSRLGFHTQHEKAKSFIPFKPQTSVTTADVRIFTPLSATNFVFSSKPLPLYQIYFAKQFGLLAKNHGCHLIALHVPEFAERTSSVITESSNWSDLMQTDVCVMGIPTGRLFRGLSESETRQCYFNPGHLNLNGQKYFTALITPTLIQFYGSQSKH